MISPDPHNRNSRRLSDSRNVGSDRVPSTTKTEQRDSLSFSTRESSTETLALLSPKQQEQAVRNLRHLNRVIERWGEKVQRKVVEELRRLSDSHEATLNERTSRMVERRVTFLQKANEHLKKRLLGGAPSKEGDVIDHFVNHVTTIGEDIAKKIRAIDISANPPHWRDEMRRELFRLQESLSHDIEYLTPATDELISTLERFLSERTSG